MTDPQELDEVSAIIGLAGDTAGAVVLSFARDTAIQVVSKLAGRTYAALGVEVIDGVGELVNIIAGNAKQHLSQFNLSISLPKVIMGKDHKIASQRGVPTIVVPFDCSLGNFAMEVSLKTP